MAANVFDVGSRTALQYWPERVDLAAAFRWAERLNLHEAVANHFSLAVNEEGTQFLMNPNQVHFRRIRASDLLLLDANNPEVLNQSDAPDPSAWGLHGSLHRRCPQARCAMHIHSIYATVLASLQDSNLPPIDQNTAMFFNRYAIDQDFGGIAFTNEGERCAAMLKDPRIKTVIMGHHGVLCLGDTVADTFNRLYYFERAAETYIKALQTGKKLRVMSDELAEKVAREIETYPGQADRHLEEIKLILDSEGSDYAS